MEFSHVGASVVVFCAVFAIGLLSRCALWFIPERNPIVTTIKHVLTSISATFEETCYKREYFLLYKHHGGMPLFVILAFQNLITNRTYSIGRGIQNPLATLRQYHNHRANWGPMLLIIFCQLGFGLALSYTGWSKFMYYFGMTDDHKEVAKTDKCSHEHDPNVRASLTSASFALESFVVFADTWAYLIKESVLQMYHLNYVERFVGESMHILAMSAIIVWSQPITGGFFNPAMAIGHMWNCEGVEVLDKTMIYVVGPLIFTSVALGLKVFGVGDMAWNGFVRKLRKWFPEGSGYQEVEMQDNRSHQE